MKVSALRFKKGKKSRCQVRPARNDDWPAIEKLLSYAKRHYLALEWWTIQEWLGSPTFMLITDLHQRVMGLMLAIANDGPVAWLRAVNVSSDEYLEPLLEASAESFLTQGGTGLAFLGNDGWIVSKLKQADFQQINRVVTLGCVGPWPTRNGPSSFEVRTVTAADIDAILTIDRSAFSPTWWYDREILRRALSLAHCYDVAIVRGECVGYQLSTLRGGRGHIVRLAVHPNVQRRGIGGRLLSEAMRSLGQAGAQTVTVNTQEDNQASLQLYRRFSFERVGKPWAMWFKSLV